MAALIKVPFNEVVAFMEQLTAEGVSKEHLARLRMKVGVATFDAVIKLLKFGHRNDPIYCDALPHAADDYNVDERESWAHGGWIWNLQEFIDGLLRPDSKRFPELDFTGRTKLLEIQAEIVRLTRWTASSAHLLDFMLANQDLLPKRLRRYRILFPTTRYRRHFGRLTLSYFRALIGDEDGWRDEYVETTDTFDRNRDRFSFTPCTPR